MGQQGKRFRWPTQRRPKNHAPSREQENKRFSFLSGLSKSHASIDGEQGAEEEQQRRIYVNVPLPDHEKDERGVHKQHFARNKVRTAKYTPLSFLPKNLFYQFHNVANIYFLLLIILGFFPIFGAQNPGLNAVPLIVIICITAIKDAIEDWRRTVLDMELNNTPVQILVNVTNHNIGDEQVSIWRRFKKACSRGIRRIFEKHGKQILPPTYDLERASTVQSDRTHPNEEYRLSEVRPSTSHFDTFKRRFSFDHEDEPPANGTNGHLKVPHGIERIDEMNDKKHGSIIDPHIRPSGDAKFKKDYWKHVHVGDIVRIRDNDPIPADVVVLSTSDSDGACYIETKNLDGETNLKVRHALRAGRSIYRASQCEQAAFILESEVPHPNLYSYSGVVRWRQRDPKEPSIEGKQMAESVSISNLLLRGCSLRNTEWVIGVVAFTGAETKIMKNAGETPSKRSRISRELNWNVIVNFVILFGMCFVSGLLNGIYWGKPNTSSDYFEFGSIGGTPALNGLVTFWTGVILFQNLVPISLYISIEIIKTAQAFFIFSDTYMYYEKIDYPCTPKSWNISDDLGQIEYIFSDKTGTLTQNVMEFKKCTINGVPYGEAYTEAMAGMQKRKGIDVETESKAALEQIAIDRVRMIEDIRQMHDNPYLDDNALTFVSPDFIHDLQSKESTEQAKANFDFMLALALCHSVLTDRVSDDPPRIEFRAQSPDEAALVATARDMGFTLSDRTQRGVIINVHGVEKEYEVLTTLEFNSSRKRMSAIIRMPDTGKIMLFCKGADSVIYARLAPNEQRKLREETANHLEMFASEGLRTLCVASRELSEEEYRLWSEQHEIAASAIHDRETKLDEVAEQIEQSLILMGGTAIEDRLQDGVPESIALLAEAGIKLWVLTGDKVETAINIGYSCNLLDNSMELINCVIPEDSIEQPGEVLGSLLQKNFNLTGTPQELKAAKNDHRPPARTHALIIDGESLKCVLNPEHRPKFLLLCTQCRAVLCCRVSPSQKASVVTMVKKGLEVMTLSIGDGANDVAMIQEADVGVGIAGEEGRQAVMSSDYAIGQFRFLSRLLLVHGRWSYRRLGEMIANFFYKNMVWTFAIFWFQIYNSFDGSYLFDYTYILLFNLAFTSLPVILMGILDQDVDDKVSLAVPMLYTRGILRKEWNATKFWVYMADGLYQSVVCFFFPYLIFYSGSFATMTGIQTNGLEEIGVYVACGAVPVVNFYVMLNQYRWDWFFLLITMLSSLLVLIWTVIFSQGMITPSFYGAYQIVGTVDFWAIVFLVIGACLAPRFVAKSYQKMYMPRDIDVIREQVRLGYFKDVQDSKPRKISESKTTSTSSDLKVSRMGQGHDRYDDERPMFAASHHTDESGTTTTSGPRWLPHRLQHAAISPLETVFSRASDRGRNVRSSFDRFRQSYESPHRSSVEIADRTTALGLLRTESSVSRTDLTAGRFSSEVRRSVDLRFQEE